MPATATAPATLAVRVAVGSLGREHELPLPPSSTRLPAPPRFTDQTPLSNLPRLPELPRLAELSDDDVIALQRALGEHRRQIDAQAALVAAEIAFRSRRELGYDGLAQRRGMRTPEALVQQLSGVTTTDARSFVRVGTLLTEHSAAESSDLSPAEAELVVPPTAPWLREVVMAASAGTLSLSAVDAIRTGLGEPSGAVAASQLAEAASRLLREAGHLTVERLAAAARAARDDLDLAGIALREAERRDRRYLSLTPLPDGMTRISGLLDPESAAIVVGAIDAATSPRRGGPRFVDTSAPGFGLASGAVSGATSGLGAGGVATPLADDERTIPQVAADTLVELIRLATLADEGAILGGRRVGVRVHVAQRDLERRAGAARLEGEADAVSIDTAERIACEAGIIPIVLDSDGQVVNVGRQQRLFTARQRIGLAARDGGCRFPGCERPPSWCEAHHINHWHEDGGNTDIRDGVLLCRHHHLLVHNNGWKVIREGAEYRLLEPPGLRHSNDEQHGGTGTMPMPAPMPVPMPAKNGMPLAG